jgi:hypothetical protein
MRLVAIALCAVLATPATRADPIAGQGDPRFVAALTLWLADDEVRSLPALAALAADGNRAAQILLGLIDRTPPVQGPWLATRPRAARRALTRDEGGLSGRTWLADAAADTSLARLWIARDAVTATPPTALAFAALGENRAARLALQAIAARQGDGFAAVADDPRYPPGMRYLVWNEWAATPAGRARAEAEIARLPPGDPQILLHHGREPPPESLAGWLAGAALAAPLRSTCAICPAEATQCLLAAYRLGGDYPGLLALGTPSETLVPADVWLASPRGRRAPLRVASARGRFGYETAMRVEATSPCLADALAAEVTRFRE